MPARLNAARIELERHDWSAYRAPMSSGPFVPEIFARMLEGGDASTAPGFTLYGRLEVQSMLFGIWVLYSSLRRSNAEFVLDILAALDEDAGRLEAHRRAYLKPVGE
ncbi:hypothetical protein [Actinoplanes subtropicus]|uniref:hypothetical protein n=1 Tax=Actinoplanes subtropicus TaxID=543632 RepID=UPI0004C2CD35|nr:hypothetical protein [Actinoplanes subtropicus]